MPVRPIRFARRILHRVFSTSSTRINSTHCAFQDTIKSWKAVFTTPGIMALIVRVVIGLTIPIASLHAASLNPEHILSSTGIYFIDLSPDGSKYVTLTRNDENTALKVYETETQKLIFSFDPSQQEDNPALAQFSWIDNQWIAIQITKKIIGFGRLQESKSLTKTLIYNTSQPDAQPKVFKTPGNILSTLPNEPTSLIYHIPGISSRLYLIDVTKLHEKGRKRSKTDRADGGQFKKTNQIAHIDEYVTRWFLNSKGRPFAALTTNDKRELSLKENTQDNQFKVIKTWSLKDRKENKELYIPIKKSSSPNEYYVINVNAPIVNKIYIQNFETNQRTIVFDSGDLKIIDLQIGEYNHINFVKVIKNDQIEYLYSDGKLTNFDQQSSRIILDKSINNQFELELHTAHNFPGEYILRNTLKNKTTSLGYRNPKITSPTPSQQYHNSITNEGLEISYLLNTPISTTGKKFPLIVMPHGGPIGHFDTPYYDTVVQFWLASGFATLRVNFRGSGGNGVEFEEKGMKEYGKGMLSDIHSAVLHAIKHYNLHRDEIALFGMSYGGYAASQLAIQHPETYRCAVSFAGISDLNLIANQNRSSATQNNWIDKYLGSTKTDHEKLKSESPLYQLKHLKIPLLLMHGNDDSTVSVEHFYRMKEMNHFLKKDIKFKLFNEMPHSPTRHEDIVKVFSTALEFVIENTNSLQPTKNHLNSTL